MSVRKSHYLVGNRQHMMRRIAFWIVLSIGVACAVVLTGQILQLADFASRLSPVLGEAVFWTLVFIVGGAFSVPVVLMMRLPPALVPPAAESGPEFERHLDRLRLRMARNPLLHGRRLGTPDALEAGLAELDQEATNRIRAAASRAFLTTAISQNGALDALVVLGIQARLTWDVAKVYSQRPALRELVHLYSNVAATAYLAGELDDVDFAEAMEPALSAVLGSAIGIVPGMQVASSIFVNSVMSGTANAFLTLRVGVIAREHSRALTRPRRGALRRTALTEAAALLGGIVLSGTRKVSAAITLSAGRGVKGAVTGTGKAVAGAVTGTGRRVASAGAAVRDHLRKKSDLSDDIGSEGGSS